MMVVHLTTMGEEVRLKLLSGDVLTPLLVLLESNHHTVKKNALLALSHLASSQQTIDLLFEEFDVLPKVIAALEFPSNSIKRFGARFVSRLASSDKHKMRLIDAGIPKVLAMLLHVGSADVHTETCSALANMTTDITICERILRDNDKLFERLSILMKDDHVSVQWQCARVICNLAKIDEYKLLVLDLCLSPLMSMAQFGEVHIISIAVAALANLADSRDLDTPERIAEEITVETHWRYVLNDHLFALCQKILRDVTFEPFYNCAQPLVSLPFYSALGFTRFVAPLDIETIRDRADANYYTSMDSFLSDIMQIANGLKKTYLADDPLKLALKVCAH